MRWLIEAMFDRRFYSPGDQAQLNIRFTNTGFTALYVSDMQIRFDYMKSYRLPKTANRKIPPQSSILIGRYPISLLTNVVGKRFCNLRFKVLEEATAGFWLDQGLHYTTKSFISISPKPWYRIFLSRSIRSQDLGVGNAIKLMIDEWGFQTNT